MEAQSEGLEVQGSGFAGGGVWWVIVGPWFQPHKVAREAEQDFYA